MMIRKATISDLKEIMKVMDIARKHMRAEGNNNQWINGYPQEELITDDIEKGNFYVVENQGKVVAAFAYIIGEDPTYKYIEGGKWLNENPYAAVHRIGSDGTVRGIMHKVKKFCLEHEGTIRIDTHHDNKTMKAVLEKEGFTYCGVIYVEDGSPRDAYQFTLENL